MLELVERLAELHIKRARVMQLQDAAWQLVRTGKEELREKARVYDKANKLLFAEIERIEALIGQEL